MILGIRRLPSLTDDSLVINEVSAVSSKLESKIGGVQMTRTARRVYCAAIACLMSTVASAHHSFAAEFLADQTRTIEGTVKEVWFRNPHVRYYIEIRNDNGETETWDVRTSSPTILVRRGWNQETISEGDKVTVEGFLGRDGRKLLSLISIELPDGNVLHQSY
jgi:hypothetical protein